MTGADVFRKRREEEPPEDDEQPPPFTEADVDAAIARAFLLHRNEQAARQMWAPIERRMQAEQQRMRDRGLL